MSWLTGGGGFNADPNRNGVLDLSAFSGWFSGSSQSNVLSALNSFNSNGLQLVTSMAGDMVGWQSNGSVIDIHQNTADGFWNVLKDQGIVTAAHA